MTARLAARLALPLALAAVLAAGAGVARAQTLRIGLREDPDILDPTLARTFVGRVPHAVSETPDCGLWGASRG